MVIEAIIASFGVNWLCRQNSCHIDTKGKSIVLKVIIKQPVGEVIWINSSYFKLGSQQD